MFLLQKLLYLTYFYVKYKLDWGKSIYKYLMKGTNVILDSSLKEISFSLGSVKETEVLSGSYFINVEFSAYFPSLYKYQYFYILFFILESNNAAQQNPLKSTYLWKLFPSSANDCLQQGTAQLSEYLFMEKEFVFTVLEVQLNALEM